MQNNWSAHRMGNNTDTTAIVIVEHLLYEILHLLEVATISQVHGREAPIVRRRTEVMIRHIAKTLCQFNRTFVNKEIYESNRYWKKNYTHLVLLWWYWSTEWSFLMRDQEMRRHRCRQSHTESCMLQHGHEEDHRTPAPAVIKNWDLKRSGGSYW